MKLYFDFFSQPSRALYIFLKINKIPFEPCPVALQKGEHLTKEFKEKLTRFGKVPFIHDGDFKLAESVAIVRYAARKHDLDSKWYPKELRQQARVDEYLEWQHNNTRTFCALYFQKKWLVPMLTGEQPSPDRLKNLEKNLVQGLNEIENVWLANSPYLAGDQISVADIFGACEIEQPRIAGFDAAEGRPVLSAWLEKVRKETGPVYEEAHVSLNKLVQKTKEQASKAK
ncbi:glutathione S-transferase theta-1 [Asbolus verrucosus]|uniref:glutathione transferase n=1 Tax=Asbolus verrucosus TaxID=1661398 RepID=A0A482VKI7_ASBVE|nr:glutathione S-transferase theta-1 [Asbolus verrucosus]